MSNWLDLSSSSNRFIRMYVQGFVDISGGNLIIRNNDISLNGNFYQSNGNVYINKLYVANDVSLNGRLTVASNASFNGKLTVASDVSFNGKLTVANDMSLNGNLTMTGGSSGGPGPYLYLTGILGFPGANTGIAMTTYPTRTGGPSAIINTTDDGNSSGPLVFSVAASGNIGASTATERMRIDTTGNVAIGTTAPTGKLHIYESTGTTAAVNATSGAAYGTIVLEHGNSGGNSSIIFKSTVNPTSDYGYIYYMDDYLSSSTNERSALCIGAENDYTNSGNYDLVLIQKNGGYVGIGKSTPGYTLDVSGTVNATSYNATSDYRIKSNVIALSDTSYSVDLLKPVTYMNKSLGKQDIGFIAHELQEHIPFLVSGEKDAKEHQTVNYIGIIGLLTKEIQDLKKENKDLREKIENIELRLSNM
jgi:hypothetical protein